MVRWLVHASAVLVLAFAAGGSAEYAPSLAVDSELDRLTARLATRLGLSLPQGYFAQPLHADAVRALLDAADSARSAGSLSAMEERDVARLRMVLDGSSSLRTWQGVTRDARANIHLRLLGRIEPAHDFGNDQDSTTGSGTLGVGLSGNIGSLSFYSGVDVATDYSSKPFGASAFQPYDGVPYTLYGRADSSSLRASDMIRGGLHWQGRSLSLTSAIDRLKWGPAVYNPLVLSGYAPPLVYGQAVADLRLVRYVHLAGLLRSQKDRDKYLYAHRLEFPLRRWHLDLGVSEMVITGSTTNQVVDSLRPGYYPGQTRDWEWVYLIPFVPFSFAEHYLGDRDNSALSIDLNFAWPRGFRWYAELLLDDITAPWTLFSDDWGNKWALTAGGQWFGRAFKRDVTATLEYARIEPWVYTHFYGGSHNFTHYGTGLGAPGGPNSDALHVVVDAVLAPRHTLGLEVSNTRKGSDRGSDINDIHQDTLYGYQPRYPDSWTKEFLDEPYTRTTRLALRYRYDPFGRFRLALNAGVDLSDDGVWLVGAVSGGFVW